MIIDIQLQAGQCSIEQRWINSSSAEEFRNALAHGGPLYDAATLRRYVNEDLAVLEDIRPDLVVGDFRLSLSVSARVARIPYATITSAYWSPYARPRFPLPEHPLVDAIGVASAQRAFDLVRPFVFAYHARPMNR